MLSISSSTSFMDNKTCGHGNSSNCEISAVSALEPAWLWNGKSITFFLNPPNITCIVRWSEPY